MQTGTKAENLEQDVRVNNDVRFLRLFINGTLNDYDLSPAVLIKLRKRIALMELPEFKLLLDEGLEASSIIYSSKILHENVPADLAIKIGALLAKYSNAMSTPDTKAKAYKKFFTSEAAVKFYDQSVDSFSKSPEFIAVRRQMRVLLADFDPQRIVELVRLGPGTTSTPGASSNTSKRGFLQRQHGRTPVYSQLFSYFSERGLDGKVGESVQTLYDSPSSFRITNATGDLRADYQPFYEKLTTVPKNTETDRMISTYPLTLSLFTNAANDHLQQIIHHADQKIEFVRQDHCSDTLVKFLTYSTDIKDVWTKTATVDFSDASGNVSWYLLAKGLIDNQDVLEFLDSVRGHDALISTSVKRPITSLATKNSSLKVIPTFFDSSSFNPQPAFDQPLNSDISDVKVIEAMILEQHPEIPLQLIIDLGLQYRFENIDVRSDYRYEYVTVDIIIPRFSHAGMGSGVTFPIMSALIGAITKCFFKGDYRVFGDDVILMGRPAAEVKNLLTIYEKFGLKVNHTKTCYGNSPIRECVGRWFVRNVNPSIVFREFTPVYVRSDISSLFTGDKCNDLQTLSYSVDLVNYMHKRHVSYAFEFANKLLTNSAIPIPIVEIGSGNFGIEVVDPWRFYKPSISKDGVTLSRYLIDATYCPKSGFAHKVHKVVVDSAYQCYYLQTQRISAAPSVDQIPSKWTDSVDLPEVRSVDVVDVFSQLFARFSTHVETSESWIIHEPLGTIAWQAKLVASIVKSTMDESILTDRPRDQLLYFVSTDRMYIPLEVLERFNTESFNERNDNAVD